MLILRRWAPPGFPSNNSHFGKLLGPTNYGTFLAVLFCLFAKFRCCFLFWRVKTATVLIQIPQHSCRVDDHSVWRARHSDLPENSSAMVVNEKIFFSHDLDRQKFLTELLIESHYKTIFGSVRMACCSYILMIAETYSEGMRSYSNKAVCFQIY